MSICVCAKCKKPWKGPGSPARCPDCGEVSFAIAIQIGSEATANESDNVEQRATQNVAIHKPPAAKTRANLSASAKERWQNPEYRVKQSIASKKLWQDPEYRARQIAIHTGRYPSPEIKAKISAALTRSWHDRKRGGKK